MIEHLPDPWKVLKELSSLLKSEGMLCLTTGNWDSIAARHERERWRLMTPPGHLYFFTRKTINDLLKKCGLRIIQLRTNDYFSSVPSFPLNINLLRKLLRILGMGDIMTVYAAPSE